MDEQEQPFVHTVPDDEPHPRRRFRPVLILGVIALVALIVGGSIFTFTRLTGVGGVLGLAPAPTLTPGSNVFYFSESPAWGTIAVDGHVLHPLPTPGSKIPPLVLSSGTHDIVWQAAPFPTVHCILFLPFRYSTQSCPLSNPITIAQKTGPITAQILSFSAAISDLPQNQLNALAQKAQDAMTPYKGTTLMQTGEHFALSPYSVDGVHVVIRTTTSPITATLNIYVDISSFPSTGGPALCSSGGLIDEPSNCMNNGQSCFSVCPLTGTDISTTVNHWVVLAPLNPAWAYVQSNGQEIASYQGDPAEGAAFLVALSISRSGSQWQVTLAHSKSIDSSAIGNPACDAAQYEIGQDSRLLSVAGSSQSLYWKYVSGSNAAAGCVAEAFLETPAGTAPSNKPVASCLYRFGVTLALDNEAHRSWPFLLQANAYEQGIAQQIVAQAQ